MEWGSTTAAALLLALVGVLVYLLQKNRAKPRQRQRLPPSDLEAAVSLLFVAGRLAYRLVEIEPRPLSVGSLVDLEGETYIVARIGRAPLPADDRRCAFVEPRE